MSEKQKQVEKERKAVLQLLLEKTGLKYKEVVDSHLVCGWQATSTCLLPRRRNNSLICLSDL